MYWSVIRKTATFPVFSVLVFTCIVIEISVPLRGYRVIRLKRLCGVLCCHLVFVDCYKVLNIMHFIKLLYGNALLTYKRQMIIDN